MAYWTTEHEIEYVKGMGKDSVEFRKLPRKQLLLNYLRSIDRRSDWGEVDKEAVRQAVLNELASLTT